MKFLKIPIIQKAVRGQKKKKRINGTNREQTI